MSSFGSFEQVRKLSFRSVLRRFSVDCPLRQFRLLPILKHAERRRTTRTDLELPTTGSRWPRHESLAIRVRNAIWLCKSCWIDGLLLFDYSWLDLELERGDKFLEFLSGSWWEHVELLGGINGESGQMGADGRIPSCCRWRVAFPRQSKESS